MKNRAEFVNGQYHVFDHFLFEKPCFVLPSTSGAPAPVNLYAPYAANDLVMLYLTTAFRISSTLNGEEGSILTWLESAAGALIDVFLVPAQVTRRRRLRIGREDQVVV